VRGGRQFGKFGKEGESWLIKIFRILIVSTWTMIFIGEIKTSQTCTSPRLSILDSYSHHIHTITLPIVILKTIRIYLSFTNPIFS
jgi:hypothetical protein